jgi:predicted DNA-binding transcriptional regulator AlpA
MTDTTNNQAPQPSTVGASRLQALRLSLSERPVITADEAFLLLHIDRSTGYKAIKDGTFPVPVLRVGRLIRIPSLALIRLLEPPGTDEEDEV